MDAATTVLNVFVRAEGGSSVIVTPGAMVQCEVVGELSDDSNEGLAFVVFDLVFSGGSLQPVDVPSDPPMSNFVIPPGITNPAGFGGTTDIPWQEGELVQVGGGQNVILNTVDNAPFPIGSVITGIAGPGSPEVLATGTLTTPGIEGTYTLTADSVMASVIKQGESGDPFWATEGVGVGTITNLTVEVSSSPPVGACCVSGGSCGVVTVAECNLAGGTYPGDGSECENDADGDGVDGHCGDACPNDWNKTVPGVCGCGVADDDRDSDGVADCNDHCPDDPNKTEPGVCGCGVPDVDTDLDTVPDCHDRCPERDDRIDRNQGGTPDCLQQEPIPTISTWGVLILALLLLVGGKSGFRRRRPVTARKPGYFTR